MRNSPQDVHKKALGRAGERAAVKYLKKSGYKILKRNYRTAYGEADIDALDKDTVVFCEVKTRGSTQFGTPAEAVERHKRERYVNIARDFLMRAGRDVNVRFDVIEVTDKGVNHIPAAFLAGE